VRVDAAEIGPDEAIGDDVCIALRQAVGGQQTARK
jgi:hypothetical protein